MNDYGLASVENNARQLLTSRSLSHGSVKDGIDEFCRGRDRRDGLETSY